MTDAAQLRSIERSKYQASQGALCRCGAWRGAYGLEPTIEMYVAHTVKILREVRRVLRTDGVCFWNLGDSYNSGTQFNQQANAGRYSEGALPGHRAMAHGLKSKDLCLIPSRVAIAAQSDGWWVRSMIVWAKPNPMPESVTDRPTDAYEHIIMLTKSATYYWDADAVREPLAGRLHGKGGDPNGETVATYHTPGKVSRDTLRPWGSDAGRNLRNVWNFATQPFAGQHFATYPEELPRRCILAATSAKGACIQCGAPWERVVRRLGLSSRDWQAIRGTGAKGADQLMGIQGKSISGGRPPDPESQTIGWTPTCRCKGQHGRTTPCIVLDPFAGSGTTGRVAIQLRRRAFLFDLAYGGEYSPLATARTSEVQTEMYA